MRSLRILAFRAATVLAALALLLALALSFEGSRSLLVRFALSTILAAHGMDIAGGDLRVERDRIVGADLEIDGEYGRVLLLQRLDIAYDWRAVFGRSDRRYGVRRVEIDRPSLRLIVLPDGSTNLSSFLPASYGTTRPAAAPAPPAALFDCDVLVRDGRLDVENPTSYGQPGRAFAVTGITIDAALHGGRDSGTLYAHYQTPSATSDIRGSLSENDAASFADVTLYAPGADLAPPLDAFLSTHAFAISAGIVDATVHAYDVGYAAADGPAWRLSGSGYVRGGRLRFNPLVIPVRDISGPLTLQGGYLGMPALRGAVAGMPVDARGSIRLFNGVRIALRAQVHGDLGAARRLFSFGRDLVVSGPVSARIRVDGPLDGLHVGGVLEAHGSEYYDRAPFGAMRAAFYYHDGHVTLPGVEAKYAGGRVDVHGDIDIAGTEPGLEMIATSTLPVASVPVAANLNQGAAVQTRLLVAGPLSSARFDAFARTRGGRGAKATLEIAGRFGATTVSAAQAAWPGGDITARTGYDHADPSNRTLFASVVATHAPLVLLAGAAELPGVTGLVALPAMSGTIDGAAILHGTDDGALQTVAALRVTRAHLAGAELDDIALRAHGTGSRIAIDRLTVAGRDIRARATGAARIDPLSLQYAIALRGTAAADLSHASGVAGAPAGNISGNINGDFEAAINSSGWAASIASRGGSASVAGLPLRDAYVAATGASGSPLRFGASASVFGGDVAALGTLVGAPAGSMWASGIDAATVAHAAGLPLDAGTAVMIGAITPSSSGDTMSAAISLAGGRLGRTGLGGDADLTYHMGMLHALARVDVGGTRARVNGNASNVAAGRPLSSIPIDASVLVRDGDAGGVLAPFLPATAPVRGTFDAAFTARGAASAPALDGTVRVGAGTIRGVTFTDTAGVVSYRDRTFTLRDGQTQLGGTRLSFGGLYGPQRLSLRARSAQLDLSDVNDFFRGYDALDGTGHATLAVSFAPGSATARGDVAIVGAEVAGVPLGAVSATFSGVRDAVHTDIAQHGELGQSQIGANVAFPRHAGVLPDVRSATYDVSGRLSNVDLSLLTRFAGLEDLGVRGSVDATGRAHGTVARAEGDVAFAVHDGYVQRLRLQTARGTLHSDSRRLSINDALVEAPFGRATGGISLARSGALSGDAAISLTDLGGLASFAGLPGRFAGSAAGTLTFAGTLNAPEYRAALRAGRGSALGIGYDDLSLHASYSRNALSIGDTSMHLADGRGTLALAGTLPLQLAPLALGPANKPIHLTLTAQHVRMNVLDPLITGFGTVDGTLEANATASGLAGKPQLGGSATLRNGTIASRYQTVPLRNVSADVALSHDSVTLSNLAGLAGNGSFGGSGAATVVPAVGLRSNAGLSYYAKLHARDIPLAVPDWVSGTLNGDVSLTRSGFTPYLAGTVALRDGTIPFSAIYTLATTLGQTVGPQQTKNIPGVPQLQPGHMIAYGGAIYPPGQHLLTQADLATPPPTIFDLPSLNLGLSAKMDNERVRGGPVDITAGGTLAVNGSVRDPQLDGVFTAKRGQITAFGITFRIVRGELSFDPEGGVLPSLDADAVTNVQGDRVTLAVSGRIDHLNTQLSSSQGKSAEQILSTLVTGTDVGALYGGINQQTLVSGATQYLGMYLTSSILNPFSNALAQSLNIEQVSFGFAPNGALQIDVRKFVSPTVALLYTSTTTAPVTQSYGVAYNLRDIASLEFSSSIAPSGFTSFLLNMRFTFK
jgi:hypothetical protein